MSFGAAVVAGKGKGCGPVDWANTLPQRNNGAQQVRKKRLSNLSFGIPPLPLVAPVQEAELGHSFAQDRIRSHSAPSVSPGVPASSRRLTDQGYRRYIPHARSPHRLLWNTQGATKTSSFLS